MWGAGERTSEHPSLDWGLGLLKFSLAYSSIMLHKSLKRLQYLLAFWWEIVVFFTVCMYRFCVHVWQKYYCSSALGTPFWTKKYHKKSSHVCGWPTLSIDAELFKEVSYDLVLSLLMFYLVFLTHIFLDQKLLLYS